MAEFKELNKSAIGARIRKRRELLGLSREELAEQLGVTAKFIGDIEYGEKGVSMKNLYRLKQILGVGADFLLEGAEDDLRFAWYAGIGEKTRNGFGCLGLAEQGVHS